MSEPTIVADYDKWKAEAKWDVDQLRQGLARGQRRFLVSAERVENVLSLLELAEAEIKRLSRAAPPSQEAGKP
jgi:hypothetical protein